MSKTTLIPDVDYYISKDGLLVFTKEYHLKRGFCCQSGCLHCPYDYSKKVDPNVPAEFNSSWSEEEIDYSSCDEEDDSDDD